MNKEEKDKHEKFLEENTTTWEEFKKEVEEYELNHPIKYFFECEWYRLVRGWEFITGGLWREIKWFWQRGRRGWSDRDWWNMSSMLSEIIPPMLKKLKKEGIGLPTYDESKTEEQSIKEWDEILDKISKTFETAREIIDYDCHYMPSNEWDEEVYKKLLKSTEEFNKEEDKDYKMKVMTKEESKEYEEGWDLLKKYFFSLWD